MASRKKPDPAALRTLGLFTGKTPTEEAETLLYEPEEPEARSSSDPRAMVEKQEEVAITWLGLDAFHEGDDVRVAVHPQGHAVLMFVRADVNGPFHTATFKLSKAQWGKLRRLAAE